MVAPASTRFEAAADASQSAKLHVLQFCTQIAPPAPALKVPPARATGDLQGHLD
jgi:hypothetical protein